METVVLKVEEYCSQHFLITVNIYCLTGNGQSLSTSFSKVAGNVQDRCKAFGECVRQNGVKVIDKTVTISKESLHNGATALNSTIKYTKESFNKIPVHSISDIITKAKCVIPKNADNILRAALLQQCISPSLGKLTMKILSNIISLHIIPARTII